MIKFLTACLDPVNDRDEDVPVQKLPPAAALKPLIESLK
jgi:hypothetical protein